MSDWLFLEAEQASRFAEELEIEDQKKCLWEEQVDRHARDQQKAQEPVPVQTLPSIERKRRKKRESSSSSLPPIIEINPKGILHEPNTIF